MQTITRNTLKLAIALLVLVVMFSAGFSSSVAYAAACTPTVTLDLYARTGMATLYGTTSTTIWGYAAGAADPASLPGPVLDVNQGDCVQVTLHNVDIPEATSLLFQGQAMIPDTTGVTAGGDTVYVFAADSAGTFLYEAGLIPNAQHQVAMGMVGALVVRPATAGQAYNDPATAFDNEKVLVLSEVDPVLNSSGSPASFDMRDYAPQYFLINGRAYPGTDPFVTADPGTRLLLRYVNAGMQAHAMSTLGLPQTIIAQDGEPYIYAHNVVAETIATGQTLDTILTIPGSAMAGDQFALYDANMLLHNTSAAGFGGMMAFVTVGTGAPPVVDAGPAVSGLSLTPNPTDGSVPVTVSATLTDSGTTATNIHAAEFYIDGTANPPNVMTGAFDTATSITASGTIASSTLATLSSGYHTIYVRGQDANGNWGPFLSATLNVDKAGPATTGLTLSPNPSTGAESLALTATGNDTATGGSNVTAAEYWMGADPGVGMASPMTIVAAPAGPVRDFTATIPAGLSQGSHLVSVRSQDAFGNWGAATTITLIVGDTMAPTTSNVAAIPNPSNGLVGYNTSVLAVRVFADFSDVATGGSNIAAAEGFIDAVGSTGSGFVFVAADGGFNSPTESGYGDIPLATVRALSDGSHTLYVHARDASGNWGDATAATTMLTVDKTGPTFGPVTVSPPSATRGGGAVNVTVSGSITSLSDLNFSSGSYTITDSKSNNVVNGTFTITAGGSFSFSTNISRANSGPNNASNRRYYTFTISATDTLGNVGTTTAQFWVQ